MEENNIKIEINQKDFQKYIERMEEIGRKVDKLVTSSDDKNQTFVNISPNPQPIKYTITIVAPNNQPIAPLIQSFLDDFMLIVKKHRASMVDIKYNEK